MMNKKFVVYAALFFLSLAHTNNISAQDKAPVTFGKIKVEDFTINSPLIDANTSAVIIADVGDTKFEGTAEGWFKYIYKRQTRIKIIDKKALELTTVLLGLYQGSYGKEVAEDISAAAYNIENGIVKETKLNPKDVYEEKVSKDFFNKKFAVPGAKEGSIIEFTYTIKSNFLFNPPNWKFQSVYGPTLWSEYNITIPSLLSYMSVLDGYYNFFIDKASEGFDRYMVGGNLSVSTPTIIHRWVKKDIPSFNEDNYIYSSKNFIDQISFQLYRTYNGQETRDVANNWKKVTDDLMARDYFGGQLDGNNYWLDKIIKDITGAEDNSLDKSKKIYSYIRDNYTCTHNSDETLTTTLQDVIKNKSGTVGDINLLFIAMLRRNKITAYPVVLSTRGHGRCRKDYALLPSINYVIAKIVIDSLNYYVDATNALLPFGKLAAKCYNGFAREVSWDTTAIDLDPLLAKNYCQVTNFITNGEKKGIEGSYTHNMGFFESLNAKADIAELSLAEYKKDVKQSYSEDITVDSIQVENLQLPEKDLSVKVNYKLTGFDNADIVYFNPMMGEAVMKNPFAAAERLYPVEMPYVKDDIYTLNMEVPKGYAIDELPKSTRISLNENDGMFEYLIKVEDGIIYLQCRVRLKKAIFQPDDYQNLRDFYAYIVKKEAEQIVFKKIK